MENKPPPNVALEAPGYSVGIFSSQTSVDVACASAWALDLAKRKN